VFGCIAQDGPTTSILVELGSQFIGSDIPASDIKNPTTASPLDDDDSVSSTGETKGT